MTEQTTPEIATPEEILSVYTTILRTGKPSEQLKAGESLAKYLPMDSLQPPRQDEQAVKDLVAMVEEMEKKGLPPLERGG